MVDIYRASGLVNTLATDAKVNSCFDLVVLQKISFVVVFIIELLW